MTLYVGTSGWAYKEWKPAFYPRDLPQSRWLEHYGTKLTACEINATYYSRQKEATVTKWAEAVPETFRFASKGHRMITPRRPDAELLRDYLNSLAPLGARLGAVMFQFSLKRDPKQPHLEAFLDALPYGPGYAFDLKHESWDDPGVTQAVVERDATLCYSDRAGDPPPSLPGGAIGYVRLRSPSYTTKQRDAWKDLLLREARDRDVYVFVKHEDAEVDDDHGGVQLAQWLASRAGATV